MDDLNPKNIVIKLTDLPKNRLIHNCHLSARHVIKCEKDFHFCVG